MEIHLLDWLVINITQTDDIEGLATVCIGIATPWILIDTPSKSSKWLDAEEIRYISLAVQTQDGGTATQEKAGGVDWKAFRSVLSEWHIYFFSAMYWAAAIPNSGMSPSLSTADVQHSHLHFHRSFEVWVTVAAMLSS